MTEKSALSGEKRRARVVRTADAGQLDAPQLRERVWLLERWLMDHVDLVRASGDVVCRCGHQLRHHTTLSNSGGTVLGCDGRLYKL